MTFDMKWQLLCLLSMTMLSTVSAATELVSCQSTREDIFRCPTEPDMCIAEVNTCDGNPDCPDGADEKSCPVEGEENGGCGEHMEGCKLIM